MNFVADVKHEMRTTVVPTIHTKKDIIAIAREAKGAKRFVLQQFRPIKTPDLRFVRVKPYTEDYLDDYETSVMGIIPRG